MITALTLAGWTGNDLPVRLAAPTVRDTHPVGYYHAHLPGPANSSWRPPFYPVRRRRGRRPERRRPGHYPAPVWVLSAAVPAVRVLAQRPAHRQSGAYSGPWG